VATRELTFLPSISTVDEADDLLARFLSRLEDFAVTAESFGSDPVSLEDAHFLDRAGIDFEHRERIADPATIARLLVFADETLDDADTVRREAARLREALLVIYRYLVIDRDRP
jgi:hypothetical protein